MAETSVLSPEEMAQFEEKGHIRIPEAFPREEALSMQDAMWAHLHEMYGTVKEDRSTWSPVTSAMNERQADPIYKAIESERFCGAIDQFLGPGIWQKPKHWGSFLVTFPPTEPTAWTLPTTIWHWDTHPGDYPEKITSLRVFLFFSEVKPQGGGTLMVEGGHRLTRQFVKSLPPKERKLKFRPLRKKFEKSNPWLAELCGHKTRPSGRIEHFMDTPTEVNGIPLRVIEMTGEPGDAILCHPLFWHAGAPNVNDYPRFMRTRDVHVKG